MKTNIIASLLTLGVLLTGTGCEDDFDAPLPEHQRQSGIVGGTPTEYETWKGVIGLVSLSPQGQHLGIC